MKPQIILLFSEIAGINVSLLLIKKNIYFVNVSVLGSIRPEKILKVFISIMKTFETEDVFALFYAWTQKICTSFRLVQYY